MEINGLHYDDQAKETPTLPHRALGAGEFFERIRPSFAAAGLTRVADITKLDRVGIPVFVAIRPNSWSLSVSQGKGPTPWDAKIGAAMESLESFVAERCALSQRQASYRELSRSENVCDPMRLSRIQASTYHPDRPLHWVRGFDLLEQREMWVPQQVVDLDFRVPSAEPKMFLRSSNGLASGSTVTEALYHALCEVIERDAWTLFMDTRDPSSWSSCLIDCQRIHYPVLAEMIEKIRAANLELHILDATSDVGLPTMTAWLFEQGGQHPMAFETFFFGSGTHHNPYHAMVRAVSEAIQGRLTIISGIRDDISRYKYEDNRTRFYWSQMRKILKSHTTNIDPQHLPQLGRSTVADDVELALSRLRAAGIEHVVFIPLKHPDIPIEVVRVVVPDLEGAFHMEGVTRGVRHRRLTSQ